MTTALSKEFVLDAEQLARFIMSKRNIRANGSIKQDAFIPPRDLNLSVTRHGRLTEEILCERGRIVALQRGKSLLGRADLIAQAVRENASLDVLPAPLDENPEHAHIVAWPNDKPGQKAAAQQLAAAASFVQHPERSSS